MKGEGWSVMLTIVFVVLKLTEVIDWSWWWVLSPLWIGLALFLVITLPILAVGWFKFKKEKQ